MLTRAFAGCAPGIPAEPPDRPREAVGRHREVNRLPIVVNLPAEVRHQLQVFTELPGELIVADPLAAG
jgi:hypothetical protein